MDGDGAASLSAIWQKEPNAGASIITQAIATKSVIKHQKMILPLGGKVRHC